MHPICLMLSFIGELQKIYSEQLKKNCVSDLWVSCSEPIDEFLVIWKKTTFSTAISRLGNHKILPWTQSQWQSNASPKKYTILTTTTTKYTNEQVQPWLAGGYYYLRDGALQCLTFPTVCFKMFSPTVCFQMCLFSDAAMTCWWTPSRRWSIASPRSAQRSTSAR